MDKHSCISLLQHFAITTHQMFRVLSNQLSSINVTAESPFLLYVITKSGPMTQKEIAEKIKIRPATLTVRLQRLEKLEYIKRETDLTDKRIQRVTITDKGRQLLRDCYDMFDDVAKSVFAGFSEEEVKDFMGYIERLNINMDNYKKKG